MAESIQEIIAANRRPQSELASIKQLIENYQPKPDTQFTRTALQGATFGFADEIEAAIGQFFSDKSYDEYRDEIRNKLYEYKTAYPTQALSAELLGAVATSVMPGGSIANLGRIKRISDVGRAAGRGTLEGAAYGLGSSEEESFGGMARDTAVGGVTGLVTGAGTTMLMKTPGFIAKPVFKFFEDTFGNRFSTQAQAYIQNLADQSGKSIDEIIADIAEGRIITDNPSVDTMIKKFIDRGGKEGQELLDYIQNRAQTTQRAAMQEAQQQLAPNFTDAAFVEFRDLAENAFQQESKVYNKIYKRTPDVNQSVQDALQLALERSQELQRKLARLYQAEGIVPLFKVADNGAVEIVRLPSLKTADLAYRTMRDMINDLYTSKSATDSALARVLEPIRDNLKNKLDEFSPALKQARKNWSSQIDIGNAFQFGYRDMFRPGANIQEIRDTLSKKSPEEMTAIRAGAFSYIKNLDDKGREKFYRDIGDPESGLGRLISFIAPGETAETLINKFEIAGAATGAAQRAPSIAGSQTSRMVEDTSQALPYTASDMVGFLSSPGASAALNMVSRMVRTSPKANTMTDQARAEVVKIITSENPDLLLRAVNDDRAKNQLMVLVNNAVEATLNMFQPGISRGITQQSVQESTPLVKKMDEALRKAGILDNY